MQINWSGQAFNFISNSKKYNGLIINQNSKDNHAKIELDVDVYKQESELHIREHIESRFVFYNHMVFDYVA